MSYCLNPDCQKPQNPSGTRFCQNCGSKLLMRERYRAIKLIGQGGFGRTFLAVDEDKPSKPGCVIKQFLPQALGTNNVQKAAELFEQEAVRLDDLGKHPQIPELFAHFGQDGRQYLVQQFIDGQNLAQALEAEGAVKEAQIRELLNSLLPVLGFIHSHNVIHRDIKPENIILTKEGTDRLVLVDFGAAKYATVTGLLKTGTSIGTPEYIAPEQARGKAVFASDLYSLGVTCIHLLTKVSPFDLFDVNEDAWVWRRYLVNNPISDELGRILDKLIENAINRRYQSADEVMKDLNLHQTENIEHIQVTATPAAPLVIRSAPQPLTQTWRCVHTLRGHSQWVRSVAFRPDGKTLASGSEDNTIKLWHLETGKEICTLTGHSSYVNSVAFSPDGQILVSGSEDKTIKLWHPGTGRLIRTLGDWSLGEYFGHSDAVNSVAISADGQTLVSGSKDKTIKIWRIDPGVSAPGYGQVILTLTGHSASVRSVAISPDGETLASGSEDNTIKLWQVVTRREICTLGGWFSGLLNFVNSVAFSPDGQTLASGRWDKTIKLWHLGTGQAVETLNGHTDYVRSVAFSPRSPLLASGSDDKTIKLWHLDTGQELCTLTGHSNLVISVAFSPDGETLASGSADNTIKIWRCH